MIIYRVCLRTQKEGNEGYEFFSSREAADKRVAQYKRDKRKFETPEPLVQTTNLEPTKTSIIEYLNRYANHPKK